VSLDFAMRDLLPKTKNKNKEHKIYFGEINEMKLWSWAD